MAKKAKKDTSGLAQFLERLGIKIHDGEKCKVKDLQDVKWEDFWSCTVITTAKKEEVKK